MAFTSYLENGCLTVVLTGEIDHQCAKSCIDAIASKIEVYTPRECVLDFGEVSFMDSSGIGLVMGRYRQMKLLGGMLKVINIPDHMYRIFAMSGLEALGVLR